MKFDGFIEGKIEMVLTTEVNSSMITHEVEDLIVDFDGWPNDRHSGHEKKAGGREKHYKTGTTIRNNRQWSAISLEELELIAQRMKIDVVKPEWIGANLVISGIPNFSSIRSLSHIFVNPESEDAPVLTVFEQNKPCHIAHKAILDSHDKEPQLNFAKAAENIRGLVGWVDKPGIIRKGDRIKIRFPKLS